MSMHASIRDQSETSTPKVRKSRHGKPNGPLTETLQRTGHKPVAGGAKTLDKSDVGAKID